MIINIRQIVGNATKVKKVKEVDDNTWMMTCSKCGEEKPMSRECMGKEIVCESCRKAKR